MPFEFQNLALAWIIKGENYVLDGNDKGGIYGNGQAWYSWAKDEGNKYGRYVDLKRETGSTRALVPSISIRADGACSPMSFAIVESRNVVVKNWSVIQPQFWAS